MNLDGVTVDHLIGYGSGWAIVGMFVLAILAGRLIPRATHVRELAQVEKEAERVQHDMNEWRTEGRIKDQQLAVRDAQIAEKDLQLQHLAEVGRTVKTVLAAVRDIALGQKPQETG